MDIRQEMMQKLTEDLTKEQVVELVLTSIASKLREHDDRRAENYNAVGRAAYMFYRGVLND